MLIKAKIDNPFKTGNVISFETQRLNFLNILMKESLWRRVQIVRQFKKINSDEGIGVLPAWGILFIVPGRI